MSKNYIRLLLLLLTCALTAHAQVGSRTFTATAASGADTGIGNIGSGIAWHQLTWNVIGDGTGCSVKVQQAPDNTTWSDLITSQVCTANGQSAVVNVIANYIRINVTAFAGTGSVVVHWNGFNVSPTSINTGQMIWSGFLAAPTSIQTFSNFIPTSQITIIRIQAVVGTAAVGCATFPVWSVYNIGTSSIVTSLVDSTALVFDTGAISVTTPGGAFNSLGLRVTTAAAGCGTPPANLNLTVTYTMP